MDLRILGSLIILLSVASCQVLNGYINPLWMSRRGRARQYDLTGSDYYFNSRSMDDSNLFYSPQRGPAYDRRATDLLYMDERGRYFPVYRQDRLYSAGGPRRQLIPYEVDEQQPRYMPLPASPSSVQQ